MQNNWKVIYYISPSNKVPVKEFIESLSFQQRSKVLRIIKYITEYGLDSIINHLRKLSGTPLWEIRILGRDNIRVIYVVPLSKTVLLLHGFIKKEDKTSSRDLELAIKRYNEWTIDD